MEDRFQMECIDFSELVVLEDAVTPWCGIIACYCTEGWCGVIACGNKCP